MPKPDTDPQTLDPSGQSGSSEIQISLNEPLMRYVTDLDHLLKTGETVHWRAFRPKPTDRDLSIACIDRLQNDEVWLLGDRLAGIPSGRTVVGRADITRQAVLATRLNGNRLEVVRDEPPERHAVIVGWPDDRDRRKALAIMIAAESRQVVR